MLFRTHFVFSLFIFLISYKSLDNLFIFSLFFMFAVLFVDIDSKESKMGKILIFRPLQFFLEHRGIFHSLFFCFAFSFLFYFLAGKSAAIGFFLGFLSHLILDCLTLQGVMLFWPLSKKRVKGFFKTNGIFEWFLFSLFLFLDTVIVTAIFFKIIF
ncbi:MAG: metal-dependent hydrolase [Candidatus Pacearchaeota archaeon]